MAFEQKPDTGVLFENNRKTSDYAPDYKGNILISKELLQELFDGGGEDAIKLDIAAWKKLTNSGELLSLKVSKPFVNNKPATPVKLPDPPPADLVSDDDLPF
jgi:hypothetical protein